MSIQFICMVKCSLYIMEMEIWSNAWVHGQFEGCLNENHRRKRLLKPLSLWLFLILQNIFISLSLSLSKPLFLSVTQPCCISLLQWKLFKFLICICLQGGKKHKFHTKVSVLKLPLLSKRLNPLRRFSRILPTASANIWVDAQFQAQYPMSKLALIIITISSECHTHLEEKTLHGNDHVMVASCGCSFIT